MRTVRLRLFVAAALSIADRASAPSFEADIARPMTRREKRSSTGATWSHPSSVRGNFTPVTLAAARHFKHAAERGDGKVRALDLNEREPPGLCFAKNFAAVFRISRSISSCLFSRRRRASSATFVAGERSERRVACNFACIFACTFVSALHPVAQRSLSLIQIFRDTINAAVACLAQAYRLCFELR